MNNDNSSTISKLYDIEILHNTICKNKEEKSLITTSLYYSLHLFQWQWQNAPTRQKRDLIKSADSSIKNVIELLKNKGDPNLAERVKDVLLDNNTNLKLDTYDCYKENKKNIESRVKKFLKEECTKPKGLITKKKYNEHYSVHLNSAFIEFCERYPLKEPPEYLDSEFDPEDYISIKD